MSTLGLNDQERKMCSLIAKLDRENRHLTAELALTRAERDRLYEALKRLVNEAKDAGGFDEDCGCTYCDAVILGRAALKEAEE